MTGLLGGVAFTLTAGLVLFAASIAHFEASSQQRAPTDADGIVVLTGGEHRVREGLALFAEGHGKRLLISGVHRQTTRDDLRRSAGRAAKLFDCCVDIGYDARDTGGNAEETRDWAETWKYRRLVVVTSNYHMPRSLAEIGRLMPGAELVPHPVISRSYRAEQWWLHPSAVKLVVSEYLKFLPSVARLTLARLHSPDDQTQPRPSERVTAPAGQIYSLAPMPR